MKIDENKFKISADSSGRGLKFPIIKKLYLDDVSAMNIRKKLRDKKLINGCCFDDLDKVLDYIRENFNVINEE